MLLVVFRCCYFCFFLFFFQQKTAYEMRISDWSSDVCSSDLCSCNLRPSRRAPVLTPGRAPQDEVDPGWRKKRILMLRSPRKRASRSTPRAPWSTRTATSTTSSATVTSCRSEEHTSELQSLMRISYAVFCLKKKKKTTNKT